MLVPSKFSDPALSIVGVAAAIIRLLMKSKTIKYNTLCVNLVDIYGDTVCSVLGAALSFLFLLGKISYDSCTDTVGLVS